jgi:hypothetical protein
MNGAHSSLPLYAFRVSTVDLLDYYYIIITIIIIIIAITLMQGIYNYIPETNHVSRVYNVAAVQYVQSVLHVMLFHP